MKNNLLELKNLGNTSVNWLRAVGVSSYDDLKAIGAVEAYLRVKRRGFRVSKVLLYALQGALMDVHWNDLPPDMKNQLLEEVEQESDTEAAD
jgi:DNA transformation protein